MTTKTRPRSGRRPSGSRTSSRPVLPFAIFGIVAVVVVAAILTTGGGGDTTGSEFGAPDVTGEDLPVFTGDVFADPAVGLTAPLVIGEDFTGTSVALRDDGRPKAIVFLAHWCPHCQAEVPEVVAWLDQTGGVAGVDLYSVSTAIVAGRPNFPPSEWLDEEGWPIPVIVDDAGSIVHTAYGAGGFPYWVFVGSDGTVVGRWSGRLEIARLEATLDAIVAAESG